jgi:integrase
MARKPGAKAFRNVQRVRGRDGTVRLYHRVAKVRLPDDYGSPEFAEAWAAAEKSVRRASAQGYAPGTFGELVEAFEASEDWQALADRTRADYRKVRDWLYSQGAERGFTRELDQARAERILDAAVKETNWRFAVYVLQYCRRVWNWSQEKASRKKRWGDGNPWRDIPTPKKPRALAERETNRAWTPQELAAALERAPIGLRRAYVLGACGFDGGTMTGLRWTDFNEATGVFAGAERVKTGVAGYTIVYRPLRPYLEEGPRPSDFIVTNQNGAAFKTANALQTRSSEFLRGLATAGIVGEGLTLHGLRHTIGKALADTGADLRAIQSALRHSTARMSLKYSDGADKRRAAEGAADNVAEWFGKGFEGAGDD